MKFKYNKYHKSDFEFDSGFIKQSNNKKPHICITPEIISDLEQTSEKENPVVRLIVGFLFGLAARIQDLPKLTLAQFSKVTIQKVPEYSIRWFNQKNEVTRVGSISAEFYNYIKEYTTQHQIPVNGYIFQGMDSNALRGRFRRFVMKYDRFKDIDGLTRSHNFRTTQANLLLRKGASIEQLQLMFGHKSILSTMAYVKTQPEEVLQQLSNLRSNKPQPSATIQTKTKAIKKQAHNRKR